MELLITGVALLVFVILIVSTFIKPKGRPSPPQESLKPMTVDELEFIFTEKEEINREKEEAKHLTWDRDPFGLEVPVEEEEEERFEFTLNGIIWDKDSPYAIINEEVVGSGGKVGSYTVVEIKEDSVLLDDGTERITLRIWQ